MLFDEFTAPIRERLDQTGLKYEIKARIKSPYSIWNKMQNKKVTLDEIYDILAARIIFEGDGQPENEITDCWRIYAIATNIYRPHPERLRDWLSHPKANGYQALQTTLMSKNAVLRSTPTRFTADSTTPSRASDRRFCGISC